MGRASLVSPEAAISMFEQGQNFLSCNLSVSAAIRAFDQLGNLVSWKLSISAAVMPGSQPPAHTSEADVRKDRVSYLETKPRIVAICLCSGLCLRQVQKVAPCPLAAVQVAAAD